MADERLEIALVFHEGRDNTWIQWSAIRTEPGPAAVVGQTPLIVTSSRFDHERLRVQPQPDAQQTVHEYEVRSQIQAAHRQLVADLLKAGWEAAGSDEQGRVRRMERHSS